MPRSFKRAVEVSGSLHCAGLAEMSSLFHLCYTGEGMVSLSALGLSTWAKSSEDKGLTEKIHGGVTEFT